MDEIHPMIEKGQLDVAPEELLRLQIIEPLQDLAGSFPSLRILIVPHTRDLTNAWPVLPQHPFASDLWTKEDIETGPMNASRKMRVRDKQKSLKDQITYLPNPCLVALNEVYIGITSVDILFHLSSEEISR